MGPKRTKSRKTNIEKPLEWLRKRVFSITSIFPRQLERKIHIPIESLPRERKKQNQDHTTQCSIKETLNLTCRKAG